MPLWGVSDAAETKPTYLTDAQKKQVYATAQGWVAEPGLSGNSNTSAKPEILVAVKNLAGTDAAPTSGLGLADITEIEFVTTTVSEASPGNFSVLVRFNEEVDVTGTPTCTVTNNRAGSGSLAALACEYASGTGSNELTFTKAFTSGQFAENDVLSIGANAVALSGGTIKDKGTNDASTITSAAGIGTAAGTITVGA